MKDKSTVLVSLLIEKNGDGYLASVPSIQGAFAEGDSIEEAIFNCVDVLKMIFGFRFYRHGKGSHELWVCDTDGCVVPIPHHRGKSIRKGTVGAIIREVGMSIEEFMQL